MPSTSPPDRRRNGIDFGPDPRGQARGWVAMAVDEHERRAHSSAFPAVVRIEHAALWRVNKLGHAQFAPRELEGILGHDLEPGVRRLGGESTVRKAIRDAVGRGTLAEGSSHRCLVLPATVQTAWRLRDAKCYVHGLGLQRAA